MRQTALRGLTLLSVALLLGCSDDTVSAPAADGGFVAADANADDAGFDDAGEVADSGEADASTVPRTDFFDDFADGLNAADWTVCGDTALFALDDAQGDVRISKPAGGQYLLQVLMLLFRPALRGDFDVQIDFRDISIDRMDGAPGNQVQLNLLLGDQQVALVRSDEMGSGQNIHVFPDPGRQWVGTQSTTVAAGRLRFTREGGTLRAYLDSTLVHEGEYGTADARVSLSLQNNGTVDPTAVTFDDFRAMADALVPPTEPETLTDDFAAGIQTDDWEVLGDTALYTLDDSMGDVRISKPAGGDNTLLRAGLGLSRTLEGDFDVQVTFRDASIDRVNGTPGNQVTVIAEIGDQLYALVRSDEAGLGQNTHVFMDPPAQLVGTRPTPATAGRLRINRCGPFTSAYLDETLIHRFDFVIPGDAQVSFWLQNNGTTDPTSVTFDDFAVTATRLATRP